LATPVQKQDDTNVDTDYVDPDAPAGIEGAEFFGGSKKKEEFYDPVAEREAGKDIINIATSYNRFVSSDQQKPSVAFDTLPVAFIAQSIQEQINSILYDQTPKSDNLLECAYNDLKFTWTTPLDTSSDNSSPLVELELAKTFYKQVDLAIVSGKQISDTEIELFWELALVWPTFWAPRVVLSGSSKCTFETTLPKDVSNSDKPMSVSIVKQIDQVFGSDNNSILPLLSSQIAPRFWDWYHIGMSPAAEEMPRQKVKGGNGYSVYKVPPKLVTAPTMVEIGSRENRNAEIVPNHAFTCIIKTMGPTKQEYTPTSPVQVEIKRRKNQDGSNVEKKDSSLVLCWSIPLSVQFLASNLDLPLPGDNPEDTKDSFPACTYEFHSERVVATVSYGGKPQDPEITDIRKQLYEKVMNDGLKPKLDDDGRPQFFFWQNDVKACYTVEGLGMAVYEWRPKAAGSNEVGLELMVE
jgi:hypothetical protein